MRGLFSLLLVFCLLAPAALAEDALSLPACSNVEETLQFIDLPGEHSLPSPAAGRIRIVSTNPNAPCFRQDFWANETYDLTVKGSYRADCRHMTDRAAYCMALSYLGVEMTPAMMSSIAGERDVSAPYDGITASLPQVERVEVAAHTFDTMVENFLTDSSYSPVFVKVRRPDGVLHTLLVVGYIPSTGGFIICDPATPVKEGQYWHTYKMAWHVVRETVLASDFWDLFYASKVQAVYQWRLIAE